MYMWGRQWWCPSISSSIKIIEAFLFDGKKVLKILHRGFIKTIKIFLISSEGCHLWKRSIKGCLIELVPSQVCGYGLSFLKAGIPTYLGTYQEQAMFGHKRNYSVQSRVTDRAQCIVMLPIRCWHCSMRIMFLYV